METINSIISDFQRHSKNDEDFIQCVSKLAKTEGNRVYQALFKALACCDLPPKTARTYWLGCLQHRKQISKKLSRNVSLITSLGDYLSITKDEGYRPLLINTELYNRIILESVNDQLTELNNRSYFDQVFEQQLSLAKRYDTELSLLFIDIDNFKEVNDRFGHQAGDFVLKEVAATISSEKRESDIAVRYGGEEFILLMPHTSSISALILAERVRIAIANHVLEYEGQTISITISGGIASYPLDGADLSEILSTADRAVYQAKGAGKNLIALFKEDKRRYLRVKFNKPVYVKKLGLETQPTYSGRGKDICIGGILFKNDEPLELGSRIQIHTEVNDRSSLLLIGTVVRVEAFGADDYDIGVALSFKEMEKIARDEIAGFLRADQ